MAGVQHCANDCLFVSPVWCRSPASIPATGPGFHRQTAADGGDVHAGEKLQASERAS